MILRFGNKSYDYSRPEEEIKKIAQYFRRRGIRQVLDLGCGNCRHLHYLRQQGFETYGIDKKIQGIDESGLVIADMRFLPFKDCLFDGVIANQVIYHGTKKDIEQTIAQMCRVLRENGLFFATLQPRENQEWRMGAKLEDWTYVASAGPDNGEIHHFVDEKEIDELFGNTKLIHVYQDARRDWCVLGIKTEKKI